MALRRFRGASSTSTVVFTGQAFVSRELLDTGSASGSNGSSVTLAAGASASFYLISPTGSPNLTTSVTGSWEASINFQSVTPTNIFCKFRVHRISVSGTVPTILASTEYSAEVQARRTNTPYIISTDGTNLGTFSSTERIAVEWTIRNAGAASISPQPSFGTYSRFVRTPIESTTAVGWTALDRSFAGYRPVSYSEGTIKGVKRTGSVRNTITSSGTVIGTQGGQNYSGSVTGITTSTGTASGFAGFSGSATGISTSTGTATGLVGFIGSVAGVSTATGTATGSAGFFGSSTGQSVSTGSATGTSSQASKVGDQKRARTYWRALPPWSKFEGSTFGVSVSVGLVGGEYGYASTRPLANTITIACPSFSGYRSEGVVRTRPIKVKAKRVKGMMYDQNRRDEDELLMVGVI